MSVTTASGACSTSFEFVDFTRGGTPGEWANLFRGIEIGPGGLILLKFKLRVLATCTNNSCQTNCSWSSKAMQKIVKIPLNIVAPGLSFECLQAIAMCDGGSPLGEALCIQAVMDSGLCDVKSIQEAIDWEAVGAEAMRIALDFVRLLPKCMCPVDGVAVDLTDMDMFPFSKAIDAAFDENIKRALSN